MRSIKKIILSAFLGAVALVAGTALAQPKTEKVSAAQPTEYAVVETAFMARITDCYAAGGNFNLQITMGLLDHGDTKDTVTLDCDAMGTDLAGVFNSFGFFDKVKIGEKTLKELGCTGFWDNAFEVGVSEPQNLMLLHCHADPTVWQAAIAAGEVKFDATVPVTVMEGAMLPGYEYLTLGDAPVVYKAGCDYVTNAASFAYGLQSFGKTDVESLTYVQGHDGTCGYFGISFEGDDYAVDTVQTEINQDYYFDRFTNYVLVNGETGKTGYYGLFNLGTKGVGYYAFQIFTPESELQSITIPAGTLFPTRAMTTLRPINNGNPVYIMYQTQTSMTFYKTADGGYATMESYKASATAEVEAYRAAKADADYFANTVATLDALETEGKTKIAEAADFAAVDAAVVLAKTALDGVETKAAAITAAEAELDGYKAEEGYFRAEEAAARAAAIATAKATIAAATSKGEVTTAVSTAKTAIDALKTAAQYADEEWAAAKANAKAEIEDYLKDTVYLEEQAAERATAVESGLAAVDAAKDEAEIDGAVVAAKAAMDAIQTKAAAVEAAKAELDAYKADEGLYREAQVTERAAAIATAKTAIDGAATKAAVDGAVATAKTAIDALKTAAQLDLEEAVAAAKAELDAYKAEEGTYRAVELAARQVAIDEAKALIDEATTAEEIATIVAAAKAIIDGLKTDAQYTAEETLSEAKTTALTTVNTKKAGVNFELYTEENQAKINTLYTTAKTAIENATTVEEVNAAVAAFETELAAVPQIETEKGCGSIAGVSGILGALTALACGVALRKRKEQEK